jgi:hypothetical protein
VESGALYDHEFFVVVFEILKVEVEESFFILISWVKVVLIVLQEEFHFDVVGVIFLTKSLGSVEVHFSFSKVSFFGALSDVLNGIGNWVGDVFFDSNSKKHNKLVHLPEQSTDVLNTSFTSIESFTIE